MSLCCVQRDARLPLSIAVVVLVSEHVIEKNMHTLPPLIPHLDLINKWQTKEQQELHNRCISLHGYHITEQLSGSVK